MDVPGLFEFVDGARGRSVTEWQGEKEALDRDALRTVECDVLIPAAFGGAIGSNVDGVRARLIVEAANSPITCQADYQLHERGIPVVPDILANAGGVTVSYLEWVQNNQRYSWSEERVNRELEKRLRCAWDQVVDRARHTGGSYRIAAYWLAVDRVRRATELRGL